MKLPFPSLKPHLLARHLWHLRREARMKCSPETWERFVDLARKDDETEPMVAMRLHFGFGMFIRNTFLYQGTWREVLKKSSGIWLGGADEISGIILTWLVWSVRRRAPSLKAAQEFVDARCWTREARAELRVQAAMAAADKPAASKLLKYH